MTKTTVYVNLFFYVAINIKINIKIKKDGFPSFEKIR